VITSSSRVTLRPSVGLSDTVQRLHRPPGRILAMIAAKTEAKIPPTPKRLRVDDYLFVLTQESKSNG
jgi:hypothetical protein